MLRFSAGMAKPKNVLFNLRNLRNFFVKICVPISINQIPTKHFRKHTCLLLVITSREGALCE